jgi:hypothetical protein
MIRACPRHQRSIDVFFKPKTPIAVPYTQLKTVIGVGGAVVRVVVVSGATAEGRRQCPRWSGKTVASQETRLLGRKIQVLARSNER